MSEQDKIAFAARKRVNFKGAPKGGGEDQGGKWGGKGWESGKGFGNQQSRYDLNIRFGQTMTINGKRIEGREGKGREGKERKGKERKGKERKEERKGKERKGEGKGREGKGREGKGRE